MSKAKAIVLFSGGLDSMLAVKLLQAQEIEIKALCFESIFFGAEKAKMAAQENNIDLEVIDLNQEIMEIVKNPPNGYGRNMNPCIDCHSLMFKKAEELRKKLNFDFIATGEVLGQRPFSQNLESLKKIQKIVGVEILRPLSAKLLDETWIEKEGLINRGKLERIHGRTRDGQMELVRKFNIEKYASPAGGCLLTDPEFSQRLIKMLDYWPDCSVNDVELLRYGRVYWFHLDDQKVLAVISRSEIDDKKQKELRQRGDVILELENFPGPSATIRGLNLEIENKIMELAVPERVKKSELNLDENKNAKNILEIISLLIAWYATKARGQRAKVVIRSI